MLRVRLAVLAVVLAMVLPATASLQVAQKVATSPSTHAPPVTLTAGTSTTVGSSGTSATTTSLVLPALNGLVQPLTVVKGSTSWRVEVDMTARSGVTLIEAITISMGPIGGALTQQTTANAGGITNANAPVTVTPAGQNLRVVAFGACVGCSLTLVISVYPTDSTNPLFTYPWTLTT